MLESPVATKGDMFRLESSLKGEIQRVDDLIRALKWMVGLAIALSAATLTLLGRVAISLPTAH